MEKENNVSNYEAIKKIHEVTNHKNELQIIYAYINANKLDGEVRIFVKRVTEECKVCQSHKKL